MAHLGPKIKNPGLSPRQQAALPILASTPSITHAASLSKVGRRTLHRWLQDPEFRGQLGKLQRESAEFAKGCLRSLTFQAVLHLGDLMESSSPEIRLRAIRAVLNYSTKVDEIQELSAQVQALEATLPLRNAQEESK